MNTRAGSLKPFFPLVFVVLTCGPDAPAATPTQPGTKALLAERIVDAELPRSEVRTYTESRVPSMPPVRDVADWEREARRLRRDLLDRVVLRGAARAWSEAETRVEWLDELGGDGYRIRKLRFEAVPGMWIPALLYEPLELSGRVPVVLNVNGHDGKGKAAAYKQIRCVHQARSGMLALNVEWLGMGQLQTPGFSHGRMNQLDLCGTSGLAPFYLSMRRSIDILLAHPHADPERVAVTGLSGGGCQTSVISALDERVTFANPVAGYSSFRTRAQYLSDLGDSEQTPSDFATVADYTHLTAMRAPHPTLLTYNARDDCCFKAEHALPPLLAAARPVYRLYGLEENLEVHVNHDPGTHNFEVDNRLALYRMLGRHFLGKDSSFQAEEAATAKDVRTAEELFVPLPEDNADFHQLALELSEGLPQVAPPAPGPARERWRPVARERLFGIVRAHRYGVEAIEAGRASSGGVDAVRWKLLTGGEWTVPATELASSDKVAATATETVLLLSDQGRASEQAAGAATQFLERGERVIALDPFYFGESRIDKRDYLYALLVAAVGERPLGLQASQVSAAARWAKSRPGVKQVRLVALGPRTSVIALVAAALEPLAIDAVELKGCPTSLREVIVRNATVNETPELFCFGLLAELDIEHLAALVEPRPFTR